MKLNPRDYPSILLGVIAMIEIGIFHQINLDSIPKIVLVSFYSLSSQAESRLASLGPGQKSQPHHRLIQLHSWKWQLKQTRQKEQLNGRQNKLSNEHLAKRRTCYTNARLRLFIFLNRALAFTNEAIVHTDYRERNQRHLFSSQIL